MPWSQVNFFCKMILEEKYLVKYFVPNKAHFDMNGSPVERRYFIREQSHYVANDMRKYIESFIESRRFNGEKKPNNIDGIN